MKVVIISNYLNHHQKPICDAFKRITNGNFHFIATEKVSKWRKQLGYQEMSDNYVIDCSNNDNRLHAIALINEADVVITDAEDLSLTNQRYKDRRIIFRASERLFKSVTRYLKAPVHFIKAFKTKQMYLLCNSAYAAQDYKWLGFFNNRAFKWGYFPELIEYNDIDSILHRRKELKLLWVGRLISLKHPEYAIEAADMLRRKAIDFRMEIIGDGSKMDEMKQMIMDKGLKDNVHLLGAMPYIKVRDYMEEADIFLFTSDRREGWGVVLNEAMNSACAIVANKDIGAVPFLIEDGVNGVSDVEAE